jgi:hypothetical protein
LNFLVHVSVVVGSMSEEQTKSCHDRFLCLWTKSSEAALC